MLQLTGFEKLGKKAARHDWRTFMLHRYLTQPVRGTLPVPSVSRNWSGLVKEWPVMLNDNIGCCAIAGQGHAIQEWTCINKKGCVPTDQDILTGYSAVSGYIPGQPDTDNGCVLLDALNYWRKVGIGGHKILAYVGLEVGNAMELKLAVDLFGNAYTGVQLPNTAKQQKTWYVPQGGARGDGEPGSWGGHLILVTGYDQSGLDFISWGQVMRMTWAFWHTYSDENYGLLSHDWIGQGGTSPSKFSLSQLQTDLALL